MLASSSTSPKSTRRTLLHDFRDAGAAGHDDGCSVLEGLEGGQAEGLRGRRHHVDVGARVEPVELLRRQEAGEEDVAAQSERLHPLAHRGQPVARAGHGEPDVRNLAGDAGRRVEEIVGALLPGHATGEENQRFEFRGGLRPGPRARVDGVVHDADPAAGHAVVASEPPGRVARDGDRRGPRR